MNPVRINRAAAEVEVRAAVAEYEAAEEAARAAAQAALVRRDARLRKAEEMGLRQVEIVKLTGYSRETVRQALNPEVRNAARRAAEQRRASRSGETRDDAPAAD